MKVIFLNELSSSLRTKNYQRQFADEETETQRKHYSSMPCSQGRKPGVLGQPGRGFGGMHGSFSHPH